MPDLNLLLRGISYVVVGGTATSLYMPWRFTRDVDVLLAAADAPVAEDALRRSGAAFTGPLTFAGGRLGIEGHAWTLADGTLLDLLWTEKQWVREALALPNSDPAGLPIVSLPYLVLLKMDASRSQDLSDIGRMTGGADDESLRRVREVVRKYLPDALEDLEGFIQIGRLEYQTDPRNTGDPGAGRAP